MSWLGCAWLLQGGIAVTRGPLCLSRTFDASDIWASFYLCIMSSEQRGTVCDGPQIVERKAELSFQTDLNGYYSIIQLYSLGMGHFPLPLKSLGGSNHRWESRGSLEGASEAPPPQMVLSEWRTHHTSCEHYTGRAWGESGSSVCWRIWTCRIVLPF